MTALALVVVGGLGLVVGFLLGIAVAVARATEERQARERYLAKVRRASSVVRGDGS